MDETILAISKLCLEECKKLTIKIAHFNHLDKDDTLENFMPKEIYFREVVNNIIQQQKKKVNKRNLPCNERCLGRKMDLSQCTRKRKDGAEFCGSHIKNLPNGKIGDDGNCFNKKKGERGRKRKNYYENVGDNEILTTKKYIGNELYLMDTNGIIYTYNQEYPVICGRYNEKEDRIDKL